MKKNEDTIKKVEVSMLNQMEEKMYVVKVGNAYLREFVSTRSIRLSKYFDGAYRFRTYHSAKRIADIVGGEVLRVGAYSLMFINEEDNK